MARYKEQPKFDVPKGFRPYLNSHGEAMVELLTVPGKPSLPLDHPFIEALIVQHLNDKGQPVLGGKEIVRQLTLARAIQNGERTDLDQDLYMETTLVIAIVLYVRDSPAGFDSNTKDIREKLIKFAEQQRLDASDWPTTLNWFSAEIARRAHTLKKYGITAAKCSDGNRSWVIKKTAPSQSALTVTTTLPPDAIDRLSAGPPGLAEEIFPSRKGNAPITCNRPAAP